MVFIDLDRGDNLTQPVNPPQPTQIWPTKPDPQYIKFGHGSENIGPHLTGRVRISPPNWRNPYTLLDPHFATTYLHTHAQAQTHSSFCSVRYANIRESPHTARTNLQTKEKETMSLLYSGRFATKLERKWGANCINLREIVSMVQGFCFHGWSFFHIF